MSLTIVKSQAKLSTVDAAALLGVSRQFLVNLRTVRLDLRRLELPFFPNWTGDLIRSTFPGIFNASKICNADTFKSQGYFHSCFPSPEAPAKPFQRHFSILANRLAPRTRYEYFLHGLIHAAERCRGRVSSDRKFQGRAFQLQSPVSFRLR